MSELIHSIKLKITEKWLKMLKAYSKGKMNKAQKLEQKVIQLELALKNAKS